MVSCHPVEGKANTFLRDRAELTSSGPQTEQKGGSGAGSPHVHLFGDLQHKDDVRPLVRIRADAHANQVSQL